MPKRNAGRTTGLALIASAIVAYWSSTASSLPASGNARPAPPRPRPQANARANLKPGPLEIPLDEPEPEELPKVELPERRIPYTMHIVSHFPHHEHLHEESRSSQYIQAKIVHAFERLEDFIKHVEVNLQVSEGFHKKVDKKAAPDDENQFRILAPYIFKVTVTLRNKRTVVFANPEKHAQPTLTEGTDLMLDVVKRSIKAEKDKLVEAHKKKKLEMQDVDSPETVDEEAGEDEVQKAIEDTKAAKDAEVDALYRKVEASK